MNEGAAVGVFEADVHPVFAESGFIGGEVLGAGEVLDAHADGEVDDGDGGARVHAVGPRR